jgi:hypothetical protein
LQEESDEIIQMATRAEESVLSQSRVIQSEREREHLVVEGEQVNALDQPEVLATQVECAFGGEEASEWLQSIRGQLKANLKEVSKRIEWNQIGSSSGEWEEGH